MKRDPSDEDLHLWWLNTKDVKPLKDPVSKPTATDKKSKASKRVPHSSLPVPPPKEKPFTKPSPHTIKSRQALRKLSIEAQIDLHGYTHDEAWNALMSFLSKAQNQGKRTVLVITGKGSLQSDQTLRVQVPRWLEEPLFAKYVRGYQRSQQKDGGAGAYYVYVKRRKS